VKPRVDWAMIAVYLVSALIMFGLFFAACAALASSAGRWHRTQASWYEGRRGACGKPLKGLYTAHRTARCGTLIEVCRHHRCVVVKVLDRGPYVPGRNLDISKQAADQIGLTSLGVARVKYRTVGRVAP
jgi:rare lipoprotein A